ncbi:endonuclease/exonuclease/phosphatase family protein [Parapusillimonas sp. SGNA-6]|uniref:endonuclease/exonuclease/phosphatase family protein n=1 Tax=Parapedobacter sp. SGR-10 TaxID=2710879 RepID=UPI0013D2B741|nr:endonuclease/exonuclease/phosphatase family protein [Parapedobacter sp. SGR-10]NGF55060.1 endonuclease/exonuclease/phosphatase family protein [Parapedobacter sp. SGR-10]NGM90119.1 endonuclease/exonuclease/phosphatase family protein [Parapusillimonas sp. SGNA-6]
MRRLLFLLTLFLIGQSQLSAQTAKLKIASYNIQYDNPRDSVNTWKKRLPGVVYIFNKYQFDIVGGQEPYLAQLNDLMPQIPDYAYIGINIRGTTNILKGHYTPIFYKKEKFDVLDWGTFWFSETPDKPGRGWDAHSNRICTWVKFKEKKEGKEFFFFNIHFDHKGVIARRESPKLLLSKIKEIADGYPLFVTGDFNTNQHHDNYKVLNESGLVKDSYHLAKRIRNRNTPTFNGYRAELKGTNRIDHIYVSLSPALDIKSYRILTDSYKGMYPSDHFPIMLEIGLP